MGDRMGVLNNGRIVQVGTPQEVYGNPRDTFVASFVGSPAINLLPGKLSGSNAIVMPRTFEDVMVESGAPVEARVHDVENYGVEKILTLRVGETLVRASVPARINVAIEDEVRFGWNADRVIFFDAATGVNLAHKPA